MAQTAGDIVRRAKRILQERGDGIRWTNGELIGWLNEAYIAVATQRPDAHSRIDTVTLKAGAKQALPSDGLRAMEVISDSEGGSPRLTTRRMLSTMRPGWQREKEGGRFEFYVLDEMNPATFWLYPPAKEGSEAEVSYVGKPAQHEGESLDAVGDAPISVSERFTTALLDFVLYRAFAKDAEVAANLSRSQSHYQAFAAAMAGKAQGDALVSPAGGSDENG